MDRPASQYTLVSYLIQLLSLLSMWSSVGLSGVTVHPPRVAALALPATASGIAKAAMPVSASSALRENDMGLSIQSAGRRLSPARTHASTRPPRQLVLGAIAPRNFPVSEVVPAAPSRCPPQPAGVLLRPRECYCKLRIL